MTTPPNFDAASRELPAPRCKVGEGPTWHPDHAALYWLDIPAGRVYRHDGQSDDPATVVFEDEPPIGGFTIQDDGALLLFRADDVVRLDARSGQVTPVVQFDRPEGVARFNDVIAAPDGSVLAGTIGPDKSANGLWRLAPDGSLVELFRGTGTSNGLGFSPDDRTLYWTDTTGGTIEAFDLSLDPFALTNRRTLVKNDGEGFLDGMTVDTAGRLWSARGKEAAIVCYAADGSQLGRLSVPAKYPLSCCFGGEGHGRMFVSSGDFDKTDSGGEGRTFAIDGLNATGRPEHRSRVRAG